MAFGLGEMFLLWLLSQAGSQSAAPPATGIPPEKQPPGPGPQPVAPKVVDETPPSTGFPQGGPPPPVTPAEKPREVPPPPPGGSSIPPEKRSLPIDEKPAGTPPGKPFVTDVPRTYKPTGGWTPYLTPWTVSRAKQLLATLMPGSSVEEVDPKGITVRFRGETGKQHGNPNIKRAVTAWRRKA